MVIAGVRKSHIKLTPNMVVAGAEKTHITLTMVGVGASKRTLYTVARCVNLTTNMVVAEMKSL